MFGSVIDFPFSFFKVNIIEVRLLNINHSVCSRFCLR